MRFGLIFSILLHAIVIGFFIITIRSTPLLTETSDIPVEVTTVADLANVKAASKEKALDTPSPAPSPAPPPPQAPPEPAPPTPVPPAPTEPAPAPKVTPEKEKPKPVEEPKSKPTPPAPDKKKDDKFDLDSISVLINKEQKAKDKEVKSAQAKPGDTADKDRQSVGAGTDMTLTLANELQRQIGQCWNPPVGAAEAENLDVFVEIHLRRDGSLAEPPKPEHDADPNKDPRGYAAQTAAIRAIIQCAPYSLPSDQYDTWKQGFRLNFNPSQMIGIPSSTNG